MRPLLMPSCVGTGDVSWQDNHDRTCQLHPYHTTFIHCMASWMETNRQMLSVKARSLEDPSVHKPVLSGHVVERKK